MNRTDARDILEDVIDELIELRYNEPDLNHPYHTIFRRLLQFRDEWFYTKKENRKKIIQQVKNPNECFCRSHRDTDEILRMVIIHDVCPYGPRGDPKNSGEFPVKKCSKCGKEYIYGVPAFA